MQKLGEICFEIEKTYMNILDVLLIAIIYKVSFNHPHIKLFASNI